MRILVDADACPTKDIILSIAKEFEIEVFFFFDSSHIYESDYAHVVICDKGFDSVDYVILGNVLPGDLIVTQDYGLASLVLTKKAYCINQNGLVYTNDNIDQLLNQRYMGQVLRKSSKHTKGPKKRTTQNDIDFRVAFRKIITSILHENV